MKSKKISASIIGCTIIAFCLLVVLFLIFSSDIFGAFKKRDIINELKSAENIEYVLINDNRKENYFGGEHIETDPVKCSELKTMILDVLESSTYGGTRENLLGGFCLIVRISEGENEVKLWFYEDKIEIENGRDIVICKTNDSTVYKALLSLTEQ